MPNWLYSLLAIQLYRPWDFHVCNHLYRRESPFRSFHNSNHSYSSAGEPGPFVSVVWFLSWFAGPLSLGRLLIITSPLCWINRRRTDNKTIIIHSLPVEFLCYEMRLNSSCCKRTERIMYSSLTNNNQTILFIVFLCTFLTPCSCIRNTTERIN